MLHHDSQLNNVGASTHATVYYYYGVYELSCQDALWSEPLPAGRLCKSYKHGAWTPLAALRRKTPG